MSVYRAKPNGNPSCVVYDALQAYSLNKAPVPFPKATDQSETFKAEGEQKLDAADRIINPQ